MLEMVLELSWSTSAKNRGKYNIWWIGDGDGGLKSLQANFVLALATESAI
jgi:hypothetical protein